MNILGITKFKMDFGRNWKYLLLEIKAVNGKTIKYLFVIIKLENFVKFKLIRFKGLVNIKIYLDSSYEEEKML